MFNVLDSNQNTGKVRHYAGIPEDVDQIRDSGQLLPNAQILIIETQPDGVFLYRYTMDGTFGGDTWHQTLSDALAQAGFEYGSRLGKWEEIPTGTSDTLLYVRNRVHQES